MEENTDLPAEEADAAFAGWQETSRGGSFALYIVTASDHPSRGSTLSREGLQKLDLQVPRTPIPHEEMLGRRGESKGRGIG